MKVAIFSIRFNLFLLFSTIVLSACVEESFEDIVVTEDVLYLSADQVRLTGRVIETSGQVSDHGFQIDDNPDFSSPELISLGEKETKLGMFIADYIGLNFNTDYFYRSYINVVSNEITGQTREFTTLKPRLDYFYPADGIESSAITLYGQNFTEDLSVKIGSQSAAIISKVDESSIVVQIPPLDDSFQVAISITVGDTTMTYPELFSYHYGFWQLETTFPDNQQVYEVAWVQDNDEFIFGLGAPNSVSMNNKFWKLDLKDYNWSDLEFPGAEYALSRSPFSTGNFFGSGNANIARGSYDLSNYFWKYQDGVFEELPSLPFARFLSVGHILDGELYVFGGEDSNFAESLNYFRYIESTNTWDVANAPIEITKAYPSFSYDGKAYFVQPDGNIWMFTALDQTWEIITQFVDIVNEGGTAVVLNGKAYIGLFEARRQIWEWDISANSWTEKSIFTGTGVRDITLASFAYGNKVYFFRSKYDGGTLEQDPHMELWSLEPNRLK